MRQKISGKVNHFTKDDIINSAKYMNISSAKAKKIIKEVADTVSNWQEYAAKAGVDDQQTKEIQNNLVIL